MPWPLATDTLRVLFAVREDLHLHPGGDTVQIVSTAAGLRDLGVEVIASADDHIDLAGFDCVHLWHLERVHETYVHLLRAQEAGKPVVLSPIYWPRGQQDAGRSADSWRRGAWREDLKNIWRFAAGRSATSRRAVAIALRRGWTRCRQEILAGAAVILPNSQAEAIIVGRELGDFTRCIVVPNGVNITACRHALQGPRPARRHGVLCVGHFDVRKNQLALIRALRDEDVPVTFVGGARRMHGGYYRRCLRMAGPHMQFLGPQPADQVMQLMRQSLVHACPSRFETPGLANLEAAALGCRLALGDCPPVREYFRDEATYFSSDDIPGIRSSIIEALASPAPGALARRVMADFNWHIAAQTTLNAYREALRSRTRPAIRTLPAAA